MAPQPVIKGSDDNAVLESSPVAPPPFQQYARAIVALCFLIHNKGNEQ